MYAMFRGKPIFGGGSAYDNVYSTEETRIGTWIDGKPLYRKIVVTETPQDSGRSGLVAAIDNAENIISVTGTIIRGEGNKVYVPDYASCFNISGSKVYMYIATNTSYLSRPLTLTVEYTKTTD